MENDYVLCHWRGRRWPAKVLPRTLPTSPQRKRKWAHFLKLQILSVGDMISVRKTDVESLNESHIEPITAMLANQAQGSILREEDLAWHRAFTSALDILKERDASKATRAPDAPEDGQHLEPQTTKGTSEQAAPHYTVKGAAGLYAYIPPGVRLRPLSVRLQRDPALDSLTSQVPPPTVCTPRRQQTFSPQQVRLCANDPPHSERTKTVCKKKRGLFRVLTLRHKVMKAADEQYQAAKSKKGTPDFTALYHTAKENRLGDSAELPPTFIDTVAPALVRNVQNSQPAAQPLTWERAPAAESAKNPGEGTSSGTSSVPVWQGASKASSSTAHPRVPSLASRRGKWQAPSSQAAPQEPCSSSHSQATHASTAAEGDGGQEAGEPTGVAFQQDPPTIQRGSLVWMKFLHHLCWPAVVKSMCKTARVLLIEACMPTERRSIQVPHRRLKHLDCREKETLVMRASKQYQHAVKW
ncbi:PWWP domain-containing DNA repair factor 4-like [Sorex araneus]|uniref:PWWP domain-containing DNA repair factor 4-like n=1 Tax=Sorex araneus TaxID=42254 RepID=UPI002433BEAF|nr:PWWP domain-containing DNA repair factor 4-like [Sorex araneus]